MSGDDVANIERMLAALQLSFDEHLRGADEREAKRERDHQELVQRVSALERDRDGWRSSLETAIAACLDARFPDLWTRERERERQAQEEQRARERQETIDAISNVFRWPLRISQYLLPILTLISILIALFR